LRAGGALTFEHLARALAEFEFTQVYAAAPLDRFARGQRQAMRAAEKRGALLLTAPLRNVAQQPAFMHDGAFVRFTFQWP
jgi:cytochrome c peroxidase